MHQAGKRLSREGTISTQFTCMNRQVGSFDNHRKIDIEDYSLRDANGVEEKILIGITGGIGSGKSTVSRYWAAHFKLTRIDIDGICAMLLQKGRPGWQQLKNHLDGSFFERDGQLDRRLLRLAIFSDHGLRAEVNGLIHPLALEAMFKDAAKEEGRVILVDVPLLYEAGWQEKFTTCVVVYADYGICCQRIMKRDKISLDEVNRTVCSQAPLAEKALLANHVINNSGSAVSTMLQVLHLARFDFVHV